MKSIAFFLLTALCACCVPPAPTYIVGKYPEDRVACIRQCMRRNACRLTAEEVPCPGSSKYKCMSLGSIDTWPQCEKECP